MNAQTTSGPNLGMQVTTFENPLGINGFEFVEFAAPAGQGELLHDYLRKMGFTAVMHHKSRPDHGVPPGRRQLPRQRGSGQLRRRLRRQARPQRLRLRDPFPEAGRRRVRHRRQQRWRSHHRQGRQQGRRRPGGEGIGDCMLYLVDRYGDKGSMYEDYLPVQGVEQDPKGFGLTFIDHLTHNLYFGNMQKWSDYYERLFNFREIRYFDIKGAKTGLVSKAMTAPDGVVRIPLNESSDPKSQINEYLDAYKGEGIQHIACFTDDIYETVEAMRAQGVSSSIRRTPTSR
jgi:4-hydroxyphenylpyruvate dioxygenase